MRIITNANRLDMKLGFQLTMRLKTIISSRRDSVEDAALQCNKMLWHLFIRTDDGRTDELTRIEFGPIGVCACLAVAGSADGAVRGALEVPCLPTWALGRGRE